MRVIVPLQGVVQGRGGLLLGSVIPCALFYFLQLYLRRPRSDPNPPNPPPSPEGSSSSSEPVGQLSEVPTLLRSLSRTHLSPRSGGGPAYVSGRANSIAKDGDSPYYIGLRKASEDPYDELGNPDGVIQLGLAENKVRFCFLFLLAREWSWFYITVLILRCSFYLIIVVDGLGSRLACRECEELYIGWRKKLFGPEYKWDCKLPAF